MPVLERKTKFYVFISHFLSAWGDRMWTFGVGIFLIRFSPDSLRLTAIYGFSNGGILLLFGALVGEWVDNMPRLKAARIALVLQNFLVALCAGVICVVIWMDGEISSVWPDARLNTLLHAVIIIIAIASNVTSLARKIAIERDWIVEICAKDKDLLASMSATMRAIDLFSLILAPALTGQIMYFTELGYGAVVIAGWNLLSVFLEYYLIWKVYDSVPALKRKMYKTRKDEESSPESKHEEEEVNVEILNDPENNADPEINVDSENPTKDTLEDKERETNPKTEDIEKSTVSKEKTDMEQSRCAWFLYKMFYSFIMLYRGWKTYMKYKVAFAGLGLAFLYMTVLGFDNITVGYAVSQGLNEAVMGGILTAGAISGIIGTFLYPRVRQRIGTERTGLISLGALISCLCLCVASVWAPGSPFDLFLDSDKTMCKNSSINIGGLSTTSSSIIVRNATDSNLTYNVISNQTSGCDDVIETSPSQISIWLLMVGIICARCGLWMSDLTITQLFLECVVESERGKVGGVQSSLNKLMDMIKFLLVIIVPAPHQFGLLVIISFSFICMGWVLYAKFSYSARGHLFHFAKIKACCDAENNNLVPGPQMTKGPQVVEDPQVTENPPVTENPIVTKL